MTKRKTRLGGKNRRAPDDGKLDMRGDLKSALVGHEDEFKTYATSNVRDPRVSKSNWLHVCDLSLSLHLLEVDSSKTVVSY